MCIVYQFNRIAIYFHWAISINKSQEASWQFLCRFISRVDYCIFGVQHLPAYFPLKGNPTFTENLSISRFFRGAYLKYWVAWVAEIHRRNATWHQVKQSIQQHYSFSLVPIACTPKSGGGGKLWMLAFVLMVSQLLIHMKAYIVF